MSCFPLMPFAAPVDVPFGIISGGGQVNDSNLTTYTFSGNSIGVAHPTRRVVVGVVASSSSSVSNRNINSVTVGGISATGLSVNNNLTFPSGIYMADVPTGSTADIVVTMSAGCVSCAVFWAMLYRANATPQSTQINTNNTVGSQSVSVSLPVTAGGASLILTRRRGRNTYLESGPITPTNIQFDAGIGTLISSALIHDGIDRTTITGSAEVANFTWTEGGFTSLEPTTTTKTITVSSTNGGAFVLQAVSFVPQ